MAQPRQVFRGDIAGLRAVAVVVVVAYHAQVPLVHGGFVGVDVFFVLSGFLITGRLLDRLDEDHRIDFAAFYARRARRLLPAALGVIGLTVVAAVAFVPPILLVRTLRDAAAAALYVPNLLLAQDRVEYFAEKAPSPLQHYWSLGVEEQFYLLWPLLILLGFTLLGRSRRGVAVALAVTTALSLIYSVYLTRDNEVWAFFGLPTRAWEFGVGGLLAITVADSPRRLRTRAVGALGWAGLALIAGAVYTFDSQTPWPGWRAAIPVLGAVLVILSGTAGSRWAPGGLLSLPPLLFVGLISYSVYLVHQPLLVIAQEAAGLEQPLPRIATVGLGAASIPLGWLVYRSIEKPFRYARVRSGSGRDLTLVVAAAASIAVAVVSIAGIKITTSRPLDGGAAAAAAPLDRYPRGTRVVPSNLQPSLWAVGTGTAARIDAAGCHLRRGQSVPRRCAVGDNPHAPTVALFGDSHAASFYPAFAALAQAGDIRLTTMSKGACQTVALTQGHECALWRDRVIAILNENPPDNIVLGNFSFAATDWAQKLGASLSRLPQRSRVFVIADTPYMGATPAICLSAHLRSADACNRPRQAALNAVNRAGERDLGVRVIDVTDFMCNQDFCPPIVGNLLVYRDASHLTEPFSAALASVVRAQLLG